MTCTCGARAPHYHSPSPGMIETRPTYDLNCPEHGLDALLAEIRYADLDIDEEEGSITGS